MSKKVKGLMENELKSRFEGVSECVVVSVRGLSGAENNLFRGELAENDIRIRVVKNSLAARAFADLGMAEIKDVLDGPCAIAYGGDSIVDVAKVLVAQSKNLEHLEVKGGFLDGQALDAAAANELAKLPSRAELQGSIVMLAQSPGSRIAGAVGGPAGAIAGCIKALIEKLEEGGEAEAA